MQIQEPRFKILALAPFHLNPTQVWNQPPVSVDRQSLDAAMAALGIRTFIPLDSHLCPSGGLDLHFDSLKSLHPDGMVKQTPFLAHLLEAKAFIRDAHRQGQSEVRIKEGLQQWPDLPPIDVKPVKPKNSAQGTASTVDHILDMVALPGGQPDQKPSFKDENDHIDALLQQLLRTLFDRPDFRTLEEAWRGLRLLLQQGLIDTTIKVDMAPVHPETLEETLEALTSQLITDLPNLVLLDLSFDSSPLALQRLSAAAQWAATLMVPLVVWIKHDFFQITAWDEFKNLPFIPNLLDGDAYAKLRKLKESSDGHWVCLTCNRFLIRYPYGQDNRPRRLFFSESTPLWIAPVWALGCLIAQSAVQTGWPTRFSDQSQFRIQDLALHHPPGIPPMVVEALFSRDRLDQLSRAGISPLTTEVGRDTAFLPKTPTLATTPLARQLLVSQVTQFLLWCKDNLPSETDPAALETQLRLAFQLFSQQSRPPGLEAIDILVDQPTKAGKLLVHVAVTPAPSVLPGRQPIELNLDW